MPRFAQTRFDQTRFALTGARLFDGQDFLEDAVLLIEDGRIAALSSHSHGAPERRLQGTLAPGLVDLQVNGGGGEMVGAQTDAAQLQRIMATHARLGATAILPTLITDTAAVTARVIAAGIACSGHPGFLGLHLEGPHLDPRRNGAHDRALIRPMEEDDLLRLCAAATELPALMVTLAPASVSPDQIRRLTEAGVIVSLGHAEADYAEAEAATRAGASCATHLFNAMSQPQGRAPGLAGAVLAGSLQAGLIADGHHVSEPMMRVTLAARPDGIFLVSDAMAIAGTTAESFTLNSGQVLRADGCLRLADGTLAGADLTLPQAVAFVINRLGAPPQRALHMASALPGRIAKSEAGRIAPGLPADLILFDDAWAQSAVWQGGRQIA